MVRQGFSNCQTWILCRFYLNLPSVGKECLVLQAFWGSPLDLSGTALRKPLCGRNPYNQRWMLPYGHLHFEAMHAPLKTGGTGKAIRFDMICPG